MTVFSIKLLAVCAMICDHLGYWLSMQGLIGGNVCIVMRSAGRLAFPLFCFLIANGYEHSSDKKRYLTRLISFAALSQLPFTLVFTANNYAAALGPLSFTVPSLLNIVLCIAVGLLWHCFVSADKTALLPPLALLLGLSTLKLGEAYLLRPDMNVFYTLAAALAVICVLDGFKASSPGREHYGRALALVIALLVIGSKADYGLDGMLLIVLLWLFRKEKAKQLIMLVLWCLLHYPPWAGALNYFICAALAALPIFFYNGRLGKAMKTAFYLVYPLHLSVLGIIALL